ncbi:hypothetical protein [Rickettsiales endosymbiont of Stachyamoeba lipophora]|uniref:hypothetical protein n=1 Tax=Rickettsiales endosymbiont of Stachyamoeba lipophora TaxID=2486578 RepID=UPI000F64540F|nr:hypothetical protein [Rickettsiales endosymbiont of Stachyamoeba lipophora]AZL15205.1 hypothetical protein EF513_01345 [Rickettsiales endosymbiont of Stachyamoeba lipophora]
MEQPANRSLKKKILVRVIPAILQLIFMFIFLHDWISKESLGEMQYYHLKLTGLIPVVTLAFLWFYEITFKSPKNFIYYWIILLVALFIITSIYIYIFSLSSWEEAQENILTYGSIGKKVLHFMVAMAVGCLVVCFVTFKELYKRIILLQGFEITDGAIIKVLSGVKFRTFYQIEYEFEITGSKFHGKASLADHRFEKVINNQKSLKIIYSAKDPSKNIIFQDR